MRMIWKTFWPYLLTVVVVTAGSAAVYHGRTPEKLDKVFQRGDATHVFEYDNPCNPQGTPVPVFMWVYRDIYGNYFWRLRHLNLIQSELIEPVCPPGPVPVTFRRGM